MLRFLSVATLSLLLFSCAGDDDLLKMKRDITKVQEQVFKMERDQVKLQRDLMDKMRDIEKKVEDRTATADTQDQVRRVRQEMAQIQAILTDLEGKVSDVRASSTSVALANPATGEEPNASMNTPTEDLQEVPGDVVQNQYRQAYLDYTRGKNDVAIDGFRDLLANYPNSPFTEKAMYYLASCLYSKEQYQEARELFSRITKEFSTGNFSKQALYYEGRSYYSLGQPTKAIMSLREVIETYPGTQEAELAQQFLKQTGYER